VARSAALALLLVLGLASSMAAARSEVAAQAAVERAIHRLGYVARDYPAAVSDGVVVNALEHTEQLALIEEVAAGLAPLEGGEQWLAAARALRARLIALAPAEEVGTEARALSQRLLGAFRVRQEPTPLRPGRGEQLYRELCVRCHGPRGRAQTSEAAKLEPPPVSFVDPTTAESMSPSSVAAAVRFGISGTAMAEFPTLTAADRWDLGFYVAAMRHSPRAALGAPHLPRIELALRSDGELLDELFAAGAAPRDLTTLLAGMRRPDRPAPEGVEARMRLAREQLWRARIAILHDDRAAALQAMGGVYRRGLARSRPALWGLVDGARRDAELMDRLLALRARIEAGQPQADLLRDLSLLRRRITELQLALGRGSAMPAASAPPLHGSPRQSGPASDRRASFVAGMRHALGVALVALLAWLAAAAIARPRGLALGAGIGALAAVVPAASGVVEAAWLLSAGWAVAILATGGRGRVAGVAMATAATVSLAPLWAAAAAAPNAWRGGMALVLVGACAAAVGLATTGVRRRAWCLPPAGLVGAAIAVAVWLGKLAVGWQAAGWAPATVFGWVGWPAWGIHPTLQGALLQAAALAAGLAGIVRGRRRASTR
jgi:high-affinity iron transporter